MNPLNLETYPQWVKEIHAIYLESGLWRRYEWYDFLGKLVALKK